MVGKSINENSEKPNLDRMVAAWFLTAAVLLFAATPESLADESGIHLTLHHVHQHPSSSDLLASDEARVLYFHHRRSVLQSQTKTNTATTLTARHEANRGVKSQGGVSVGVKPGMAIGVGNYYVKMGLGTPVNYYNMVVDTGSSLTWLQCAPCTVYCHPQIGPIFNPAKSKTFKYSTCKTPQCASVEAATLNAPICDTSTDRCLYEASYGDSSYSVGYLSKDVLTLSSATTPTLSEFAYGCAEDTQGLFGRSAGLIGFARNSLSMTAQLAPKYGFVFSYCLPTTTNGTSRTGTFSIGRTSLYSHKKENGKLANMAVPYAFTPMITDPDSPSLYSLRWTGMTVAGKPLAAVSLSTFRNTPTIIDSGTVITRIPLTIYDALSDAIVKIMSPKFTKAPAFSILDTCYYTKNPNMLKGVPEVSMIFEGGAQMKLGPENVFMEVEKGVSCLAFAGTFSTGGLAIIGNTQQKTIRVVYDVTNSKIGFAAGGCE